ncbi:MAG: hypothetical protein V3R99_03290 [Thermoguttaceae bacterium]
MSIANHFRYGCPTVRSIGLLAVLFSVGFAPCSALGQPAPGGGYIVDPVDVTQLQNKSKVSAILRKGTFGAGEQDMFDKYYETYALARWSDPKTRHLLTTFRRDLDRDLRTAKRGSAYNHLRDLILTRFTTTASQNYHRAVRVNAMLMIGELNEAEPAKLAENPVPHAAALQTVLLPAIQAATQPDAVKVAAMAGIARHARLGAPMPPSVQTEMITLVTSETAPGPSADGRAWMRVQAARVLGAMGSLGTDGVVPNAIARMVADEPLRLAARCAAARALGELKYGGAGWRSAGVTVLSLRQLALDACDAEKDGVLRRRLASHLSSISTGLGGNPNDPTENGIGPLAGSGSGPQFVAGLTASLGALEALLIDESLDDLTLTERVGQEADKIRALAP